MKKTPKAIPRSDVLAQVITMRDALLAVAVTVGRDCISSGSESEIPAELCIAFERLNDMSLRLLELNVDQLEGLKVSE